MACSESAQGSLAGAEVVDAKIVNDEAGNPDWCRITAQVRRPDSSNVVTVWIGLPLKNWNGRFLGTSGGGFLGGTPNSLLPAVAAKFAAAATDAGHRYDSSSAAETKATAFDGSFALNSKGRLDWDAVRNFAHVGIHRMTLVAKAATTRFYGVAPRYSYFRGCSTGGRQGQAEVQRYPTDYDGVLSGAPAINWAHFLPAAMWAKVVMNDAQHIVAQCKFEVARQAAVDSCDGDDGKVDGVIDRPERCRFDPKALIGRQTSCGTIDREDSQAIREIWEGPRRPDGSPMWFGLARGSTFEFNTGGDPVQASQYDGSPSPISVGWFRYFLLQDPDWNPNSLTRDSFESLFDQSVEQYSEVFDTANANIESFYNAGGKTILWHGQADSNFPAEGTVKYVNEIRAALGIRKTNDFLRFYLAPGVGHCAGGSGPQPSGLLDSLIEWVEEGKAPGKITGEIKDKEGKLLETRPLHPYGFSDGQPRGH